MGIQTMPQPQTGGPTSTAMPAFKGMPQTPTDLEFKDSTSHPRSFPHVEMFSNDSVQMCPARRVSGLTTCPRSC